MPVVPPLQPPTVSIIVPVYNTQEFLVECVESALAQSHVEIEVVLVNDGSTDTSGEICDEFASRDDRVRVVHQSNAGLSVARNVGVSESTGAFVTFLDSDDFLDRHCVKTLVMAAQSIASPVALGGITRANPCEWNSGADEAPLKALEVATADFFRNPSRFAPVHPVSACGKLFARILFDTFEFPAGRLHEDVHSVHRLLHSAGDLAIIQRAVYCYRERPGSITSGIVSLRSAMDKARAHLVRAQDMDAYGLPDVAALEFRRGLAWHLRSAEAGRRQKGLRDSSHREELHEQRSLLRELISRIPLDLRTRMVLAAYWALPVMTSAAYSLAMRRNNTHPIEGER